MKRTIIIVGITLLATLNSSDLFAQTTTLWAKGVGSAFVDRATQVVNDDAGNTYITGHFSSMVDMDPGPGIYNLTSAGSYDVFVLKLDPDGNFLWARSLGGSVTDAPAGIAVDENQNIYLPILFNGTADLDPGVAVMNVTSLGNEDMAVIHLNQNGNFLWAKVIGGNYSQYPTSIMIDHDSNILMCGDFKGTVDFDPGPGTSNLSASQVQYGVFVLKLTNTGDYIWARSFTGPAGTEGFSASIAVDNMNNVYTTGIYQGTIDFNPGAGVFNLTGEILKDCFVTKLDENGDFSWALSFGSSSYDFAKTIQISPTNEIYVSGYFRTTCDFNPGAGINNLTAFGTEDAFILKLTDVGNYVWAKQFGGAGSVTQSYSIAVDNTGASYTTGIFDGTVDFDPNAGTANLSAISGAANVFISKLDINGNYVWSKTVGGSTYETGRTISLQNNKVFVGGWNSSNPMLLDAFSLSNYGSSDVFVAKFSQCGIDITPPVANLASLPDVVGQCNVTSLSIPTATDYCGGPVTVSGTHNATLPITSQGTTIVTWTYNDGNGNTTTQNQNVIIDDNTIPAANVMSLPDITSQCSVTSLTSPTATDNCIGIITGTHNATLPITLQGTTVVTWTYNDGNGNTTTQNQNVIIDDNTSPVANVMSMPDITGQCSVTSLTAPTANDNCSGTITGTHNATLPITSQGTTIVTWTYNDGNGNTTTQNQNVIIDDHTSPVANVMSLPDITGQCSVTSLTAPTANDNCIGTINATHNATLPITTQGTTIVTWTYDDGNGNITTQNQNVIIDDNTSPVANVISLPDITGQCSVTSLTSPTATDNCSGTITGTHNATLPITLQGTTVVTWSYNDGNGNTTTQNQNVIIDDNIGPVANLMSLPDLTGQCSLTSLSPPTAIDNCSGTITGTHNATLPITLQGTTIITWTYNDGNGNTTTQNQNVIIDDNTAPVADIMSLPDITSQCSITSLTAPTATDNCSGTITGTHNATLPITLQGTTIVTWTYDDGNGNTITQNQNVIIDDNTVPVADVMSLPDITSQCSVASLTAPTATDNCSGTITGTHNATFPITSQGTTIVTWTYDDGNGNTITQNQNVIISEINDSVSLNTITLTAMASGYNYQWIDCGNGNTPIIGETNQSFTATANGSYAVEISNGSCSVTSVCTDIVITFGVNENDNGNGIIVFPNPNNGIFDISIQSVHNKTIEIELLDMSGKLIESRIFSDDNNFHLAYPNLEDGVYLLCIKTSNNNTIHKIIIHK